MKYAFQENDENCAKAYGRALSISPKKSEEIANEIRNMPLEKAENFLVGVIEKKVAVKIVKHGRDTAHKKGIGPGKYPVNAAKAILKIVRSAASNAQNQGLEVKKLYIEHISAHKASLPWRYGRKRRSRMKRAHVQIILKEKQEKPKVDKK